MKKKIVLALKSTPPFFLWNKIQQKKEYSSWTKGTLPIPRMQKQKIVSEFAKKYNTNCLVETGTYLGEMIKAQQNNFEKIYSIEIDEGLFNRAKNVFKNKNHIEFELGDSGKVLPKILQKIDGPTLFWLDGHYSGGVTSAADIPSPIMEELKNIFSKFIEGHIILVDDAGIFRGENNLPTISEIKELVTSFDTTFKFEIDDNIIRIFK